MRYNIFIKAFMIAPLILLLNGCFLDDDEESSSSTIVFPSNLTNIPSVAFESISADGSVDDWAGVQPVLSDAVGDGGIYSGLDIAAIYLAQDGLNLYVRLQMAGPSRPPADEYHNYWLYFESNDFEFAIEAFHSPSIDARLWNITGADRNYEQMVQIGNLVANSSGDIIEFIVPKSLIKTSNDYRLDFYTHHTINYAWGNNGDGRAETPAFISF